MFIHSTCRDCGGPLLVTDGCTVHPLCTPKPTKAERLAQEWFDAVMHGGRDSEAELQAQIDKLDSRPPRLLDAALRYASWGWPVFPLRARMKSPAIKSAHKDDPPGAPKCYGACGREGHGLYDATTNQATIRRWWASYPDANIALRTGIAFDVIDIDVPKKDQPIPGAISFTELLEAGAVPDVHGQVATAHGGCHLYIPATGDGNKASIRPGIDYRGKGGYVVAPPSQLEARGRAWSWITAPSPTITTIRACA